MRTLLKLFTSTDTRRKLAFGVVKVRRPTARWRPLPNLLIIGAQRSGTSSLFKYLGAHPSCKPSVRKEVRFFTEFYDRGVDWYRSHFPFASRNRVVFEATPDYLLDPRVPDRASRLLPETRIIVLIRDPIERAYSHYWHNRRLGTERLSFEDALESEPDRIDAHMRRLMSGSEEPAPKEFLRYSYVERGRYSSQLERWFEFIARNRVLILRSEEFYADTDHSFQKILAFLGLPAWRPTTYRNFSYVKQPPVIPPMPQKSREWLESELGQEIERLAHITNQASPAV